MHFTALQGPKKGAPRNSMGAPRPETKPTKSKTAAPNSTWRPQAGCTQRTGTMVPVRWPNLPKMHTQQLAIRAVPADNDGAPVLQNFLEPNHVQNIQVVTRRLPQASTVDPWHPECWPRRLHPRLSHPARPPPSPECAVSPAQNVPSEKPIPSCVRPRPCPKCAITPKEN